MYNVKSSFQDSKRGKIKKLYHNWPTFFPVFFSTQTWIIIIVKARTENLEGFRTCS